ncbi:MAG: histidine phosphatase family protein [Reyranellales bacterium]
MRAPLAALALLLLAAATALAQEHPVGNTKIVPPPTVQLIEMLKAGGYIVFFRHGTTPDYAEPPVEDFADCSRQRNLNELGRALAKSIGEAFRELGFKIDKVVASPYCRCMDTARIAFGRVEAARDVGDGGDRAIMRTRFAALPKPGFNDVVVGHGSAGGLINGEFLHEAEAVVLRPLGDGKFEPIARVRAEGWTQMLPRNREPPPGAPRANQ